MTKSTETTDLLQLDPNGSVRPHVEDSLLLRLTVLAATLWVDAALWWVGSSFAICVGGAVLATAGHVFSWRFRSVRSVARSAVVGLSIAAVLLVMRDVVAQGASGNFLPLAHLLVLLQGAAAFEIRTRGGLYASLGLSGLIFFLASQRAVDPTFGVFLVGFAALLISFFAASWLIDQLGNSDVKWFRSRWSFAGFWSGVAVALFGLAAGVFLVLPDDIGISNANAEAAVVPIGPIEGEQQPPVPEPEDSALPLTGSGDQMDLDREGHSRLPESLSPAMPSASAGAASTLSNVAVSDAGDGIPEAESAESSSPTFEEVQGPPDHAVADPVVMNVRSPVASYWRGNVYDTFDGVTWLPDSSNLSQEAGRGTYRRFGGERQAAEGTRRYSQTYFLRQAMPPGSIFAGYEPVTISPRPSNDGFPGQGEGTVYRVVSAVPEFSIATLEAAGPRADLDRRYRQLPKQSVDMHALAERITAGASTDFEQARRIVTYSEENFRFDSEAQDQLALSVSPQVFVSGTRAGTSLDLATATVLLARAAGIPARMATGYLPGRHDPLSGTYVVRRSDGHAWAEIYIGGSGWVPFDGSPRDDIVSLDAGSPGRLGPLAGAFESRYSDEIYRAIRASPDRISDFLARLFDQGPEAALVPVGALVAISLALGAVWRLRRPRSPRHRRRAYARLTGQDRDEMLRIYRKVEKLLGRRGLPSRAPSQTVNEYVAFAEKQLADVGSDLAWFQQAACRAAYDPKPFNAVPPLEARRRLAALREGLRTRGRILPDRSQAPGYFMPS